MKKSKIYFLTGSFVFLLALLAFYIFKPSQKEYLPTYFKYDPHSLENISNLESSTEISEKELEDWDKATFNLIKKYKLEERDVTKIISYLYTAQTDFAFLSYNLNGKMLGSITPISTKVLELFFPKEEKFIAGFKTSNPKAFDEYTTSLTALVYEKIKERFELDKKQEKSYPEKGLPDYWAGKRPYSGQTAGSWKPWYLEKSDQLRAPAPPAPKTQEWAEQLKLTKNALHNITPEQKIAVVHWAGGPGTITPAGIWFTMAQEYIVSKPISLKKMLEVRAVLARALADAAIAVFDSKYAYWMKRPNMLDTSILTIMPTPNFPSYPAAHSVLSATAATILIFYFPDMKSLWDKNKKEASYSRIWGGIHFPLDTQAGEEQGKKVAEEALKKEAQNALQQAASSKTPSKSSRNN